MRWGVVISYYMRPCFSIKSQIKPRQNRKGQRRETVFNSGKAAEINNEKTCQAFRDETVSSLQVNLERMTTCSEAWKRKRRNTNSLWETGRAVSARCTQPLFCLNQPSLHTTPHLRHFKTTKPQSIKSSRPLFGKGRLGVSSSKHMARSCGLASQSLHTENLASIFTRALLALPFLGNV